MRRPSWDDESGAYAAMFVVVLTIFVGVSALAVDIGSMAFDRRATKAVADMAATAGALALEPTQGGNPAAGCATAWAYVLQNLPGKPAATQTPCTGVVATSACSPGNPISPPAGRAGPYHVKIQIGVPDASPANPGYMGGYLSQPGQPLIDGAECQRLVVDIWRDTRFLFAGWFGNDNTQIGAFSVARTSAEEIDNDLAALNVLDPHQCKAIQTNGGGQVKVSPYIVPGSSPPVWAPGIISVASDGTDSGTCGSAPRYAIASSGSTGNLIESLPSPTGVPGVIISHAALVNMPFAFDPSHCPPSGSTLRPCPTGGNRATRAPVDHQYDCRSTYPNYLGITIQSCPHTATRPAYMSQVFGLYRWGTGTGIGTLQDYNKWYEDQFPGEKGKLDPCSVDKKPPPVPAGNWYVDCPFKNDGNPGLEIKSSGELVFEGGTIVFAGGVTAQGPLTIGNTTSDSLVFIRDSAPSNRNIPFESVTASNATLVLRRTVVVVERGYVNVGGGGAVTWTPPEEGNFKALALWSEGPAPHTFGGQGAMNLTGVYFIPYANPTTMTGGSSYVSPQAAQFWTRRLWVTGGASLTMQPDPEDSILSPIQGVLLIR